MSDKKKVNFRERLKMPSGVEAAQFTGRNFSIGFFVDFDILRQRERLRIDLRTKDKWNVLPFKSTVTLKQFLAGMQDLIDKSKKDLA